MHIIPPRQSLRTGKRVYIVAPTRGRRQDFMDFITKNQDYHEPWVYHSMDPKYYDHYLKRIRRGVTQGCFICDNKAGQLLGVININNIMLGGISSASLGYYGDKDIAGTGIMTEAMSMVLDYAVRDIGLHRMEANIQPENEASIKLIKKLGFRKEGFSPKYLNIGGKWRDHERWAILDEKILKRG